LSHHVSAPLILKPLQILLLFYAEYVRYET
jgi:hypothetical protein